MNAHNIFALQITLRILEYVVYVDVAFQIIGFTSKYVQHHLCA